MTGFTFHQQTLHVDDAEAAMIAESVGTPCYVYSARLLRARVEALSQALSGCPHAMHYALKANSTLALVRLLRSLGVAADANSVGEIEVALRAGFIPDQIVFTGVGKTPDELERAVALGVKAINVESVGELERLDAVARAQDARARVAIRVNPDVDAGSHPHISTGSKRNKFGVPIGDVPALCRRAQSLEGLEVSGIHVHVGSQITSLDPVRRAASALGDLALELMAGGVPLTHLDLGGGLGISYNGSPVPDVREYGAVLTEAARRTGLSLIVEPGRWLVGPAGILIARVVDVKPGPDGRQFVVLDAGMTELLRPALYGAYHHIVRVDAVEAPEVPSMVVGPVCESSDTFGEERLLAGPAAGTLVAIMDAGAYGAVMASNYNRRPLPPEVLVDGREWRIIRRRQTVDDMLALEE